MSNFSRYFVLYVILLIFLSNVLTIIQLNDFLPVGSTGADMPPAIEDSIIYWDSDWIVTSNATYCNQTIIVNGNLIVTDGIDLALVNITLKMNGTGNLSRYIQVNNSASLTIRDYDGDPNTMQDGCEITSNHTDGKHRFGFNITMGAGFYMENSKLSECGHAGGFMDELGLYIHSDSAVVTNCEISDSYSGILIYQADNINILNNKFYHIQYTGIYITYSTGSLIYNNTINIVGTNSDGIRVSINSRRNLIVGNSIKTSGNLNNGIYLSSFSSHNEIFGNLINCTGQNSRGIYCQSSNVNITTNSILLWNNDYYCIDLTDVEWVNLTDNFLWGNDTSAPLRIDESKNITVRGGAITGISSRNYVTDSYNITFDSVYIRSIGPLEGIGFSNVYNVLIANSTINADNIDLHLYSNCAVLARNSQWTIHAFYNSLSDLTVQNYLNIAVVDSLGDPISGTNVQIKNKTGYLVHNGPVDTNGTLQLLELTEGVYNKTSSVYHTPHNITVTAPDHQPWYSDPVMDRSRNLFVTLLKIGEKPTKHYTTDWYVAGTEEYCNQTILMDGNITVDFGETLILNNCTVVMNCSRLNGQYHIEVRTGGTLKILDNDWNNSTKADASMITDSPYDLDDGSNLDYGYNLTIDWDGVLEFRNSNIRQCGWNSSYDWEQGICTYSDYVIIDHVDISSKFKGIVLGGVHGCEIINCTILINATDNNAVGINAWNSVGLLFQNNSINMTGVGADQIGILIDNVNYSNIVGNNISLTSTTGWADGIGIVRGTGNWISENMVYQHIDGTGIILWGTDSVTVITNTVQNYFDWSTAILLFSTTNSVIQDNTVILSTMGAGIAFRNDCGGTVAYNNAILGISGSVEGFSIVNAYNNFTLSNNSVSLFGANSFGLRCDHSSYFQVYNLNIYCFGQRSFGMWFGNSDNITLIGVNITTSPTADQSHGVWLEHTEDIFFVQVTINLYNSLGTGIEFSTGGNSTIIANAYICTNSVTSPALEGYDCSDNIMINTTLWASSSYDVIVHRNATIGLLNCTFTDKLVLGEQTMLMVGWFLHVRVQDELGQPVTGAIVRLQPADASLEEYSGQTNSDGWIRWIPCLGYINTSSTFDNTSNPNTIKASNATCWDTAIVDLTYSGKTVIVTLANDDPMITNPKMEIQVIEDSSVSWDFKYFDKENNPVFWSIDSSSSWVELNATNGKLTLSPNNTHVGSYEFRIRATDVNSGYDEFNVKVVVINRAPVVQSTNKLSIDEDSQYYVDHTSDDDPDTVWTLKDGPGWLNIDDETGVLAGTPSNSHVGDWPVNISVMDNHGGITWNNFTLMVNNTDPKILTDSVPNAIEDELYQVTITSSDDGAGIISWCKVAGPDWLTIDSGTGVLSGTPTNKDIKEYLIILEVDDGNGGTDQKYYNITVKNTPPNILTVDDPWADEDSMYEVDYSSTDDGQGTITWSLDTNAAGWLKINTASGLLSGTPRNAHVGSYWVNVSVDDGHGFGKTKSGVSWHNFSLIVNNSNDAPVITTKNILNAIEDQLYKVKYTATDDDGDTLTWMLTTEAEWLALDPVNVVLSGTPTNLDVGVWNVVINCIDGMSGSAKTEFNITVVNVNDAPKIDDYYPIEAYPSVEEGLVLEFNISYSDEDSTSFNIRWLLDGSTVRSDVPFWSYTPGFNNAGDHEVVVNVTDSGGASVQHRWIVIVSTANRPPVISQYSPMNLKPILDSDGSSLTFSINATDPDSDNFEIKWFLDDVDTGERASTFTLDPDRYGPGIYNVTVRVIDDKETVSEHTWSVEIKPGQNEKDSEMDLTPIIILVIVIVIIVILVFLFIFKRKGSAIEDIFIISNSGILLAHKTKELRPDMDDNILSGMLTAIQDFIKDAFKDKTKFGLRRLDFGDSMIHLKRGSGFYIAVVLSGVEPKNLETKLEKTIIKIDEKYGKVLKNWSGAVNEVRGIKDELDLLLK